MSRGRPASQQRLTESAWSKEAQLPAALPPPLLGEPPTAAPVDRGWVAPAGATPRHRASVALRWIAVVGLSSAVASALTLALRSENVAPPAAPPSEATTPMPAVPQYNPSEVSAAKDHLCKVFDLSVRGQEGQGGFRVQGNVNIPIVLRALNSASAVQNALGPAVPADLATAARKYIGTTLDVTTSAMGSTPTSEVNRLTDVDGDAIDAVLNGCGLPR